MPIVDMYCILDYEGAWDIGIIRRPCKAIHLKKNKKNRNKSFLKTLERKKKYSCVLI